MTARKFHKVAMETWKRIRSGDVHARFVYGNGELAVVPTNPRWARLTLQELLHYLPESERTEAETSLRRLAMRSR